MGILKSTQQQPVKLRGLEITNGIDTVRKRYESRLAALSGQTGSRNAQLLGIASLGIMAGVPPARIMDDILVAGGFPQLSASEVQRAVRRAEKDTEPFVACTPSKKQGGYAPTPKRKARIHDLNAVEFVTRMLTAGQGTTCSSFMELSPVAIPDANKAQTDLFIETLYNPDDLLFCGERTDAGVLGENIKTADEWRKNFSGKNGSRVPELFIINPLTGLEGRTQDNKPSFRCSQTVAVRKYFLIEFDALSIRDQFLFWGGVVVSGSMPLRSLTFSGSKSLHGIIEIQECSTLEEWENYAETMLAYICNPKAPFNQRADRACRNADRLSRLPGAWRRDKSLRQPLLWLAGNSPV